MIATESYSPTVVAPAPVVLSLEARLAAVDAEMTLRLESALLALDIDSAHVEQPVDLADVITVPVAVPTGERLAPVAALLRRAQVRVLRPGGWSRETGTDGAGGVCLEYALQAEARSEAEEQEARIVLRSVLGSGDPITHINRRLSGAPEAARLLGQAARLAAARGL
jgi:hypothetical protein